MKLDLDNFPDNLNRINGYSNNSITVNAKKYPDNLIISPKTIIMDKLPDLFTDIATQHIELIISYQPEIIIFGTGKTHQFLPDELLEKVYARHIGLETMDTYAACRCFNLLSSEGRIVIAALFQ